MEPECECKPEYMVVSVLKKPGPSVTTNDEQWSTKPVKRKAPMKGQPEKKMMKVIANEYACWHDRRIFGGHSSLWRSKGAGPTGLCLAVHETTPNAVMWNLSLRWHMQKFDVWRCQKFGNWRHSLMTIKRRMKKTMMMMMTNPTGLCLKNDDKALVVDFN